MTQQQPYRVVQRFPDFEVREYPAAAVAEVNVSGDFEQAGNQAFRPLFNYISGRNATGQSISMTAPVLQHPNEDGGHTVAFVLPADLAVDNAPAPGDSSIHVRELPATRTAAMSYSGRWSQAAYERHCAALTAALTRESLVPVGSPRFARYNAPFVPWFLRRNEVLVDLSS